MKNNLSLFSLGLSLGLLGQSVEVVPTTENYGSNGIVYNNSLFFSKSGILLKFDGTSITGLPVPMYNNQPVEGKLDGSMFVYNNKLCYSYDYIHNTSHLFEYLNQDYFITYDGATQNVFLNPDFVFSYRGIQIGDNGSEYEPVLYQGKLILKGADSSPRVGQAYILPPVSHIYSFDGQSLTKINNLNINNSTPSWHDQKLGDWALVFNNELYFCYATGTTPISSDRIAKFDGTNITVLDGKSPYKGGIFNLNNALYFKLMYTTQSTPGAPWVYYHLANYTPATNTLSYFFTQPYNAGWSQFKPIIDNSQAYTIIDNKLSIFDGTGETQINKVAVTDKGIIGRPVLFGNNIYFQYQDSNNKYLLGKYSAGSISLVPNLSTSDTGIGMSFIEFNGNLFFIYTSGSVNYLAKYDGQNMIVMQNPDNGQGVQDSKFVIYGNDLYFPYKNAAGIVNLAKYGTTVLSTNEAVKETGVSVFKEGSGFSIVSKTEKIAKIEVLDASGRKILNAKTNAQKYSFEIGTHGVFIVNVSLNNGKVSTLKVRN